MGTHSPISLLGADILEVGLQRNSHKEIPRSKIIVVDKSKNALQKVSHLPIQTAISDGIIYLNQFLLEGRKSGLHHPCCSTPPCL